MHATFDKPQLQGILPPCRVESVNNLLTFNASSLWVPVLPVSPRVPPVLDHELGATVQAAKARKAAFLSPGRHPVAHLDSLRRATFGAKTAADARLVHREMRSPAHAQVVEVHGGRRDPRCPRAAPVAALAGDDLAYHVVDQRFRVGDRLGDPFGIRQVEDGRPGVRHAHGEPRIERREGTTRTIFCATGYVRPGVV